MTSTPSLSNLIARGGKFRKLAIALIEAHERLEKIARLAAAEQIGTRGEQELMQRADALTTCATYDALAIAEFHDGLLNIDVYGVEGSMELDLDPKSDYGMKVTA